MESICFLSYSDLTGTVKAARSNAAESTDYKVCLKLSPEVGEVGPNLRFWRSVYLFDRSLNMRNYSEVSRS